MNFHAFFAKIDNVNTQKLIKFMLNWYKNCKILQKILKIFEIFYKFYKKIFFF